MTHHNSQGCHSYRGSTLPQKLEARPTDHDNELSSFISRSLLVRTVPVFGLQSKPPLQPPVAHEFGLGFVEKLHSVLPHILPAVQLYGTVKVTVAPEACSQPVGWDGTDFPTLRSVYKAGLEAFRYSPYFRGPWSHQIVKGQWFATVKVLDAPGPTLPEAWLATGVGKTELNDDVTVTARAAILCLSEQTFILVEEMARSLCCVRSTFSLILHAS